MGLLNKIDHHATVMGRMAETLGVDFAESVATSPSTVRDYRQAVLRCTACTHEEDCMRWMQENPRAAAAPDYCRNKDILERLARG